MEDSNRNIRFLVYAKGSAGEFRSKLSILKLAGKIKSEVADELSVKSIEFSAKTKTLIDYLKKFEKEKKKKLPI